jgi:LPPG:FO 2-phospho-L-lactate transferase
MNATPRHFVALCGGVGGAKLAAGLAQVLAPAQLTIVVNVGDDFEHLGLYICPDIDTVLYTLAGIAHPQQGWGREGETWRAFSELARLGAPQWFQLGDLDIALHLLRRGLLDQGATLSQATQQIAQRLGIQTQVLPVTDQRLRTFLQTDVGELAFQEYFVRRRCEPCVSSLRYDGAAQAQMAPGVEAALGHPALAAVILCPSNPYLSVGPMLAVPGLRERLRALDVPVLAVSPIVGGRALKGPAAKLMSELGAPANAATIATLYEDFVDAVLIDQVDVALAGQNPRLRIASTVMTDAASRAALARDCIALCSRLSER